MADQTQTNSDSIRVLTTAEYKEAALTLAEAFWKDEVCRYPIDTPGRADWTEEKKWDCHLTIMEGLTYAHMLKGLVTSTGPNYGCVALWMPPGCNMDDWLTILRSGLWRNYFTLCAEGRARLFTEFFPLLQTTKTEVLGGRDVDSYYLVYLGTRENARGKGCAKRLVNDVAKTADRESKAMYLESSHVGNVGLYEGLGFEVRRRIALGKMGRKIELDVMVREPRTVPARSQPIAVTGSTATSQPALDKNTIPAVPGVKLGVKPLLQAEENLEKSPMVKTVLSHAMVWNEK